MLGFIKGGNTSELIVTVGCSTDGKAKVWNAQTGQEILILRGHTSGVRKTVYSPGGQRIMTVDQDSIIRLYTTDVDELLDIAKSRTTHQLIAEEKEKYGVSD